jgi:hypothetical protein
MSAPGPKTRGTTAQEEISHRPPTLRNPAVAKGSFAVCADCMERIDLEALHKLKAAGVTVAHDCGRVLWRPR